MVEMQSMTPSEYWIYDVPTCKQCNIHKVSEPKLESGRFEFYMNSKGQKICKECNNKNNRREQKSKPTTY